ncbi:uncharacterized protein LOC121820939 [Peromyscus maniculatus bairdii]|uniref:uncharacterized protein LOC121820939 n=1 Tax=Peromyscus maniculatus bairdii TaxID=230844 RepID=UPI003FD27E82
MTLFSKKSTRERERESSENTHYSRIILPGNKPGGGGRGGGNSEQALSRNRSRDDTRVKSGAKSGAEAKPRPRCSAPWRRGRQARPGLPGSGSLRDRPLARPPAARPSPSSPARRPRLLGPLARRPPRGSPSSALTFLLPAVGRHGCPPASAAAAATAGTRVARAPQPRPQAHGSVRQSVRPSGGPARSDLTCAPLGSGAHPATRPLLLLSRLSLRPPGGPGLRASCWDAATTTGTRGRSGEETRMATAGGAKMEPASCLKQSRSRNALRCLRSVPLAERHRGRAEEAGRGGAWGAWPRRVAPPRAAWTSREPPSFQGQRST